MTDRDYERFDLETFIKQHENDSLGDLVNTLHQLSNWGNTVNFTPKGAFKPEDEDYVMRFVRFVQGFYDIILGGVPEQTLMSKEDYERIKPILIRTKRINEN